MTRANAVTDRCLFMTSPMRSGSTLLTRILSAHPAVAMSYDSVNFFRFCYHRYDPITDPENVQRLFRDVAYRLRHRFELPLAPEACLAQMGGDLTYGQAYLSILRALFAFTGKPIVGDKEVLAWTRIPHFLRMCPNGKAIVILRDPRDVVTSFKRLTIAPEPDYLIALFNVVDAVNHALRFRAQDPARVTIVSFERLKGDREQEVRKLCAFLELDFDPAMLDEAAYTDHLGKPWNVDDALTFKAEDPDRWTPVGRWRRRLEPEDLYLCEWIAGRQLASLGLAGEGRVHPQEVFDRAIQKITASPLLREAFKRWCDLGEGMERFPLNPLDPSTWDRGQVKHPQAFTAAAAGAQPS